jgi:hypothetical protein
VIKRIGLLTIGALLLFAFACAGSQGGDDKKNAKPTEASVMEVRNAFKNLAKVKAVRAEISAQQLGANGQINTTVFKYDFVPPDRYQLTSSTGTISRVVNGDLYSFANNVWMKLPEYSGKDYEGFDHFFNPKFMDGLAEEIGTTATVEKKATETINGKTCQAYVLTVVSTGNTTDVCIADNYPLRLVYHTGKLDTTAIFSDYNGNVVVDKPPVQ